MYITQKIYNIITEVIKRRFRRYKEVKAIYLRGSVSTGDVVLGKSDIDLVVLIDKFEDPLKEARFLYFLGKEYLKLKRIFPVLGECVVLDPEDVPIWFGTRTYRIFESAKWKRLYGNLNIPHQDLKNEDVLYRICWKIFEYLRRGYIKNDTKLLTFLFLEVVMLVFYLEGKIQKPIVERKRFFQCLKTLDSKNMCYYKIIEKAFRVGFLGRFLNLRNFIYCELISLLDKLWYNWCPLSDLYLREGTYSTCSAFDFVPRDYILIASPFIETRFKKMLMEVDLTRYFLVTENVFKLYLYYKNPLEYYTLKLKERSIKCDIPKEWIDKFIKMRSTRREIREFPFGRLSPHQIFNIVAQIKLYYDYGYIASDELSLKEEFKRRYKMWPFQNCLDIKEYFFQYYSRLWKMLQEVNKKSRNL